MLTFFNNFIFFELLELFELCIIFNTDFFGELNIFCFCFEFSLFLKSNEVVDKNIVFLFEFVFSLLPSISLYLERILFLKIVETFFKSGNN